MTVILFVLSSTKHRTLTVQTMNNTDILPLLPFRYHDERDAELADKVVEICGGVKKAAYILNKDEFSAIFDPEEGFKMAQQEHERVFKQSLRQANLFQGVGQREEDKLFGNVAHHVFRNATGKNPGNNDVAFRLFLSLIRRAYNEKHRPKRPRRMRGWQVSMF